MARRRGRDVGEVSRWEQRFDWFVLGLGGLGRDGSGWGRARGILRIFRLAERLTERGHVLHALQPGGVLRYEITRLRSGPLQLPGQPAVARGERILSLHFDNRTIGVLAAAVPSTQALTWRMARIATKDLRALAELAATGALPADVRAVWAESLFSSALGRYGFATRPAPRTLRTPFARLFLLAMLAIYAPAGLARLKESRLLHRQMAESWIGLEALQRRLAPAGSAHAPYSPHEEAAQGRADGGAEKLRAVTG